MKKTILLLLLSSVLTLNAQVITTFNFTGGMQTFTVPPCVDSVTVELWGAQGENALVGGATGGMGGYVKAKINVNSGDILYLFVGGQSGYNGGGIAGINGNDQFSQPPIGTSGGDGGGASDIRFNGQTLNDRIVVAGGGGGAGHNGVWPGCQVSGPGGNGGAGGGLIGANGTFGVGTPCNCGGGGGAGGLGGTQSAGGNAGAYAGSTACLRSSWTIGQNGMLGAGGNGALTYHNGSGGGGGGGGGYYGGGSGGNGSDTTPGGGGGGGSSYISPSLTTITNTAGIRTGDGMIVITYTLTSSTPVSATASNTTICAGSNPGLSASNAVSYLWMPGNLTGSNPVVNPTTTTTYTVTGTDGNGCTSTATVTVNVNALPTVTYNETQTTVCVNWPAITLTPGTPANGVYSGTAVTGNMFDPAVAGAGTHTITYTFTDGNGCVNSATSQITVDLCTGVNTNEQIDGVTISPNPFVNQISVVFTQGQQNAIVNLYNVLGEKVGSWKQSNAQLFIDTEKLSKGIYTLEIITGNTIGTRKLVKK